MNAVLDNSNIAHLKTPPHALEAERGVLGTVMANPSLLQRLDIDAEDFYRNDHRVIYRAMLGCMQRNQPADMIVVGDALERNGELEEIGGLTYLNQLAQVATTPGNAFAYAKVIRDRKELRDGISLGHEIADAGFQGDMASMRSLLGEALTRTGGKESGLVGLQDSLKETLERIDRVHQGKDPPGLKFGIPPLDKTYSMKPGDLIVIGARPSMGKTAVALNIALSQKCPVGFISLEMPHDQITQRAISLLSRVPFTTIDKAQMSDSEWDKFGKGVSQLSEKNITFFDEGGVTVERVARVGAQMKHRDDIGLLIIDYMQLMEGKGNNRHEDVSHISRQCKAIAKRLRIPVIALVQLNRNVENRDKKKPRMSDLRESGQIEQDADLIMFLYRDAVYHDVPDTTMEFLIEKCRNGPVGMEAYGWNPELMMLRPHERNGADEYQR